MILKSEFSRTMEADRIPLTERPWDIAATPEECGALARRFDLPAVHTVRAQGTVCRRGDGQIRVDGTFRAEMEQRCVVSLELFTAVVQGELDVLFSNAPEAEHEDYAWDDACVEPVVDGIIDLGEVVAQHLALEIDPFPRKKGARFDPPVALDGPEETREVPSHPFAVLEQLRKK